ncbi:hypothetical protein IFT67_16935 [Sphingomonas sp. CFBP 13728]|uniref:hypothetical protein n=1 Tax=Sphingomonas sp. CFBP 13728 TaxID=2775294 RepID=UPI00178426E9|nr:hypothetical protein [Sphingomonas sp. CFBP 13728]MBD8620609.1 hypothetical protein [Sphingomonas sp. CFBP 13728]
MIGTLLTLIVCGSLFILSQAWWRSYLNPVSLGILAWMPALVMLNWPPYFLSPIYIYLNRPVSQYIYIAMAMGFLSFWAGCALVKTLSPTGAFQLSEARRMDINPVVATGLFSLGLAVFLYSYTSSGLADFANLDAQQVAESRLNLHLGLLSFVTILMDIVAIAMFARFLRTGRWAYLLPPTIAIMCYAATLQKSPVAWLAIAYGVVAFLHPRESYRMLLGTLPRRLLVVGFAITLVAGFFAMNQARGLGETQMTGASGPAMEQIYIYSGASAIMNLSVTVDGYLPSEPKLYGAYIGRPILWHVVDRDLFKATRYFGGVNTGTYLLYGWADFRWLGFVITPLLTGAVVMIFLRFAFAGSLLGMVFGAIAIRAVAISAATDVIFDPLTPIILIIAVVACTAMRLTMPRQAAIQVQRGTLSLQQRQRRAPYP